MSETPLGRFCWYELMTTDPGAAPAFYGSVVGWGTTPFDGSMDYTMWTNGEQPIGGVMELPQEAIDQGAPPHWLAYVSTPDVEATKAKACELGGRVLAEIDVPNVGTVAILSDPQGAVFGAYQPLGDAPGHDGPGAVGEFSWHELYTDDQDGAIAFYFTLFGWERTEEMDMGERGIYQMYGRAGTTLGGIMTRPEIMPVSTWMYYARVNDMEAAVAAVRSGGGEVWNGPMEVPGGDLVAHCSDPQGAMFALHEEKAS